LTDTVPDSACGTLTFWIRGEDSSAFLVVIQRISTSAKTSRHLVHSGTGTNVTLAGLARLLLRWTDYTVTSRVDEFAKWSRWLGISVLGDTIEHAIMEVPVSREEGGIRTTVISSGLPTIAVNTLALGGPSTTTHNINNDTITYNMPLNNVLVVEVNSVASWYLHWGKTGTEEAIKFKRILVGQNEVIIKSKFLIWKIPSINGSILVDSLNLVSVQAANIL